jgi:membrane-associated phospholipid phosphatase
VRTNSAIAGNRLSWVLRRARRMPGMGPRWPSTQRLAIGAAAIVAVFLLNQVFLDSVATIDPRTLPAWIGRWIGSFSAFGKSSWILWPSAILLVAALLAANLAQRRMDKLVFVSLGARLLFLICAVALPGLAVSIVKPLIGRVRPFVNGSVDPFLFQPLAYFRELFGSMPFPEYFYGSMPSGHTANAFAAAIAFGALMPRLRPLLLAFALAMAASRLVIGVHHVTDVMAGALIGTFGALAIRYLFATHRLVFAVGPDGRVYAMAGPSMRRLGLAVLRLLRGKGRTPGQFRGLAPEAER